jgi:hypothetical protein
MPGLRDYLKEKAKEHDLVQRLERRREWVDAVTRLIKQLESWLHDADPEKVLIVYRTDHPALEQHLGHYDVPGLEVVFGDARVQIIPMGRNVLRAGDVGSPQTRAAGRVDITDGGNKFYLFRYVIDGADQWVVQDASGKVRILDREVFDKIMLELLS